MSHKRRNEQLRGERLAGDLWSALDSASWQAEETRRQMWSKARRDYTSPEDDFDIEKIVNEGLGRSG